ncbi:hypothetical protein OPT61_g1878 [Boeremia exigua]|uniref:Uncharacterized protein n=1 Tax=Boeremia exigua TaxID=749465 RepID=A0ACC2INM2_9PLEO|nr:hypothetical protein OPT61_g1878 [Boeremia exigua]
MAQGVPGFMVNAGFDCAAVTKMPISNDNHIDTGQSEEKQISQHRQTAEAGDPESTARGACPLPVHKNGGAR